MNGKDLTPSQAEAVNAWLVPPMLQLLRLRQEMVEAGFPDSDSLLCLVSQAGEGARRLSVELSLIEGRPAPPGPPHTPPPLRPSTQ